MIIFIVVVVEKICDWKILCGNIGLVENCLILRNRYVVIVNVVVVICILWFDYLCVLVEMNRNVSVFSVMVESICVLKLIW